MPLEEKDKQIEELERIIDYMKSSSHDTAFCGNEYGYSMSCEKYVEVNQDEGCIACKMIYEYNKKYRQTKG